MARERRTGTNQAAINQAATGDANTAYTGSDIDEYGNRKRTGGGAPTTVYTDPNFIKTGPAEGTWQGTSALGAARNQPAAPAAAPTPGTGFGALKPGRSGLDEKGQLPATPGTESGNTYLEDRYLNRLFGQDPAFNYAANRGMEQLGARSAAAGNFNSGAARQQESDFYANILAQSQEQLDALAGGASGARQNKLNAMFGQGLGIAGGAAGLSSAYDLGAAGNMDAANRAQMQLYLNKAGVDAKGNQGAVKFITDLYGGTSG